MTNGVSSKRLRSNINRQFDWRLPRSRRRKLTSMPYQPNVFNMFYNQEIFDEAGITENPTTWAELLEICDKVKAAGYIPITCDDAYIQCMLGPSLPFAGRSWHT